ncbi:MAG: hypothetical protein WD601_14060, partial [Pseudohongiellaceae bacterium]
GGGDCTASHGFVPVVSLNLRGSINADGLLLDPWQNPYRYSVATFNTISGRAFTTSAGLNWLFNNNALSVDPTMLRICDNDACSGVISADMVPAVVLSMGENWASFTSANETRNAGETTEGVYPITNTNDFVVTTYAQDLYDDMVIWLSPFVLYNKLTTAGQLP